MRSTSAMTFGSVPPAGRRGGTFRKRRPLPVQAVIALGVVMLAALCAITPRWFAPRDPNAQNLLMARKPPAWMGGERAHLFGTDYVGRDILSRVIYGARVSLTVGAGAVIVAGLFGSALGLASAGKSALGSGIMRLVDVQMAVPVMVMAIVLVGVLGPSLRNLIIVFALAEYPGFARIIRGEVLQLREREFIVAARAAGATTGRLIARHILPNLVGSFFAVLALEVPAVILYESGLGFLGLSVPPNIPSWGGMLADGRQYLSAGWWMAVFPGLAIATTVFALNAANRWIHVTLAPELRE